MAFNSLAYFLFLPVVYLIFYFTADRWRWLVLLGASYSFYAALKAPYLLAVLLMATCISYVCGLQIASHNDEAIRKRWLWTGSFACVAVLALLKYLPIFESQTNSIFGLNSTFSQALVSLGVSYYSLQAISYLADIYLEIVEPERHFGHYALYLAFFPKLLQGPIERGGDLLHQLKQPYLFDYDVMRSGMLLFACGLFKKVVIADHLALYANQVFDNVHDYTGLPLVIGTYAFAAQIYFDFAGYTDMARGTGRMFGINLTENFNRPYLATSVADFWRRWHISFSRWLLDYIFKPLQMGWRNWGQAGTALALIVTFLISGIWHGAAWGFVIWGLLHGTYLAASTYYRPYQNKLQKSMGIEKSKWLNLWRIFTTFNLVSFAWIFFRAGSLADGWYVAKHLVDFRGNYWLASDIGLNKFIKTYILMENVKLSLIYCVILLLLMSVAANVKHRLNDFADRIWLKWVVYYILFYSSIYYLITDPAIDFVYFKF